MCVKPVSLLASVGLFEEQIASIFMPKSVTNETESATLLYCVLAV